MQLRDYQEKISDQAADLLRQHHIAYLAMEVRTGKTITALATADKYHAQSVLFLTKKKAVTSIEKDYNTLSPLFDFTVTNYEQMHILRGDYDLIILDEAHCLSQYPKPSGKAEALAKLCAGKPIIFLSGTPTPESYSQLYHQLSVSSFSPFKDYKNFYAWAKDYVTLKKKYVFNREINDYSGAIREKVQGATQHLFITYTQGEAGFEQAVQEQVIFLDMKPSTMAVARTLTKDRVYISSRTGATVLGDTAAKLMQKLHQIYSGTVIADNNETALIFDHTKAEYIRDRFAGQKIAIFYKFKAEEVMLRTVIGDAGITTSTDEFNSRPDKWYISQVQSGREGTNLSTADCIVMLNIDYSATSYWQARARMQTKDREKPCLLYWIFASGGIEEKIYKTVLDKKGYTLSHFRKDYKIKDEKKEDTRIEG